MLVCICACVSVYARACALVPAFMYILYTYVSNCVSIYLFIHSFTYVHAKRITANK